MAIARWTPLSELDSLERRVRRLLGDAGLAPALLPAADVYETDEELVVELEVPGFAEPELTVEVTDHQLVVKGRQTVPDVEPHKQYRLHERLERQFERSFFLPHDVDTEQLSAAFAHGILEIHARKVVTAKARTVPIEAHD